MSQRDATNGYIATMCVCVSIIRTTRSTNGYIPDYRSEVRTPVRTQHKYNLDIRILTNMYSCIRQAYATLTLPLVKISTVT